MIDLKKYNEFSKKRFDFSQRACEIATSYFGENLLMFIVTGSTVQNSAIIHFDVDIDIITKYDIPKSDIEMYEKVLYSIAPEIIQEHIPTVDEARNEIISKLGECDIPEEHFKLLVFSPKHYVHNSYKTLNQVEEYFQNLLNIDPKIFNEESGESLLFLFNLLRGYPIYGEKMFNSYTEKATELLEKRELLKIWFDEEVVGQEEKYKKREERPALLHSII